MYVLQVVGLSKRFHSSFFFLPQVSCWCKRFVYILQKFTVNGLSLGFLSECHFLSICSPISWLYLYFDHYHFLILIALNIFSLVFFLVHYSEFFLSILMILLISQNIFHFPFQRLFIVHCSDLRVMIRRTRQLKILCSAKHDDRTFSVYYLLFLKHCRSFIKIRMNYCIGCAKYY